MSGHRLSPGRGAGPSAEPPWHRLPIAEVARELASDLEKGLGSAEARQRLQGHGQNALTSAPRRTALAIFAAQFKSLIVVLLIVAAAIALLLGERVEAAAILVVLGLNAVIGFLTELRAEQAITALQQQTVPTAHVVRDGSARAIPAVDLVPGDVVILTAGDRVPADGRILESARLQVQEAALTGESLSAGKTSDALGTAEGELALGDRANMAYLGTVVTDGRGLMMVTATGMRTEVGKIGVLIDEAVRRETPLERRLEQLGRALIGIVIALCAVIVTAGVLRGQAVLYMLEVGISLAIAAVPEGLPAVATMTLALGVQRMARLNALVRRLPAVETLGSTTVICTDKTGTLTRNEMTVTRLALDGAEIDVTGSGYGTAGEFRIDGSPIDPGEHGDLRLALRIGALCNDAVLERTATGMRVLGDPTEGALIVAAAKAGLGHQQILAEHERVDEVPFDSASKRMVTVHRTPGGALVAFVKGSPGTILDGATSVMSLGQTRKIAESDRQHVLETNRRLAAEALRVLAVAYRDLCPDYTPEDLAQGWTFVGLLGLIDPLREEAEPAIAQCRDAGIRTIMLTGDQPATAAAIARQLGLDRSNGDGAYRTVHARELEGLAADALGRLVGEAAVFARVSPEHKLRIVEALQRQKQIVAMTGDGINDAPALRAADIGVAMGLKGTAVAKEAADMIIRDDNFATIVTAIEQGRIIYANILRCIHFLFSCNFSEIATIFIAIVLGWPLPLAPLQILWLNIVTDVFPAMALALEPSAPDVMKGRPRDPAEPLLSGRFTWLVAWQGLLLAGATLAAFVVGMHWHGTDGDGLRRAMTIAFTTLALVQTFHAFNARSQVESAFTRRLFSNGWLWAALLACLGLQVAAVHVPFLQLPLHTVALEAADWSLVVGFSLLPVAVVEAVKLVRRCLASSAAGRRR